MHLRKAFTDYPGLTTAMCVGVLLVALAILGAEFWSARSAGTRDDPRQEPETQPHAQEPIETQPGEAAPI